jgi:hypothetical protein
MGAVKPERAELQAQAARGITVWQVYGIAANDPFYCDSTDSCINTWEAIHPVAKWSYVTFPDDCEPRDWVVTRIAHRHSAVAGSQPSKYVCRESLIL